MVPVTLAAPSSVIGEGGEKEGGQEEEDGEGAGESKGGQEEGEQQGGGKKPKKKGMNKKRPRDVTIDSEGQMCRTFASTGECQFGDKCRFMHDLAEYMKTKPEVRDVARRWIRIELRSELACICAQDIGPMCPIWELYGQCSAKISCRWAGSHYTKDGKELLRTEEQGGVKPPVKEINELRKELMWQLRKKQ